MNRSKRGLTGLFACAAVLVFITMAFTYAVALRATRANLEVARQRSVIHYIEEVLSTIKDAETGQRGFLLVGKESYLEPYTNALARLDGQQKELVRLGREDHLPEADLQQLEAVIKEKTRELDETVQLCRTNHQAALDIVATDHGKLVMDRIRMLIARLQDHEAKDLDRSLRESDWAQRLRTLAFLTMTALNLGFLGWAHRKVIHETEIREEYADEIARQKELLRQWRERLQLALDAAKMGTFEWYPIDDRAYCDKRTLELLGAKSQDALPLNSFLAAQIHPHHRARYADAVARATDPSGGGHLKEEIRISLPDGRERWLAITARTVFEESGKLPARLVGLVTDITERQRAQEILRDNEEEFRAMFNTSSFGQAQVDPPTGRLLRVNQAFCKMTGFSEAKLLERSMLDLTPPDEREADRAKFARMASGEFPSYEAEKRCVRSDGEVIWIQVSANLIRDAAGRPSRSVAIIQDITERKKSEEALRESEQRFRALVTATSDVVFQMSPDWKTMLLLRGMDFIQNTDEPCQTWLDNYIDPQDQSIVQAAINRAIKAAGIFELEHRVRRGDGTLAWTFSRAVPLLDSKGQIIEWFGTASDITARKQAEEARGILGKLESTGILAGGIAHDFNNLLNSVTLNLDMVQIFASSGKDPSPYLMASRNALAAARSLTKQLITFSKGGAPLCRPIQLAEIVRESSVVASSGSNIRTEIEVEKNLHWTNADEGQIGQVIRNLVLNARDAMPKGGIVKIRAENVSFPSEGAPKLPPGDYIQVTVSDQGEGIAPETLPKIFDPYFSTKQRGADKGMGLGLTICHTIINKHGGAIIAQSLPGQGATFKFYLPSCPPPASAVAKMGRVASPVLSNRRILVMDDEDHMRFAIKNALGLRGGNVETTANGQHAIQRYAEAKKEGHPFDVVILDLTVRAGMGAREAIRELRKIDPGVKSVVMSGYSDDPVMIAPGEYGFNAGIEKSFNLDQLVALLSKVMIPLS